MNHGSLFSGIGGFDLAAEWMGWENIFNCEIEEFPRKILNHYWPDAISYEDIKKTDFTIHRGQIDILTGGFPCQPYSQAGKRLGKDDERHLWPEMLRAIREIAPTWIVGENVYGIVNWSGGMVFEEVQADLEAEGYEVQPYILPAAAVNAPHRRNRVWFVAYSSGKRCDNRGDNRQERYLQDNISGDATEDKSEGHRRECRISKAGEVRNASNPNGKRTRVETQNARGQGGQSPKTSKSALLRQRGGKGDAEGLTESDKHRNATNSSHNRSQGWHDFPTQSPVCGRDDGFSDRLDTESISKAKWRNESIKAYGNAIVPQVAMQIFKAIEEYERNNSKSKGRH